MPITKITLENVKGIRERTGVELISKGILL